VRKQPGLWQKKVEPAFICAAVANKVAIRALARGEPRDKVRSWLARKCQQLLDRCPTRSHLCAYDFIHTGLPLKGPYSDSDHQLGLRERLHWQRHHEVLKLDLQRLEKGDTKAFDRVVTTITDDYRSRFDPKWKATFRFDLDHSALFEMGLGFGLEDLTADDVEECFDKLCPCGKKHDAEALKKQRQRMIRDLQKAANFYLSRSCS
jgi:hypothetical protein